MFWIEENRDKNKAERNLKIKAFKIYEVSKLKTFVKWKVDGGNVQE